MNQYRQFVLTGLKQAGLVFGACLLLDLLAVLFVWALNSLGNESGAVIPACAGVGLFAAAFLSSFFSGPIPVILIWFDFTNRQMIILGCLLLIPYWTLLGTIASTLRFRIFAENLNRQKDLPPKKIAKQIRWSIEIIACIFALVFIVSNSPLGISHGNPGSRHRMVVIHQLNQIDAAKEQFALDKKVPSDYVPTSTELVPYLNHGADFFKTEPDKPIRYILNPINQPAYAILYRDWRIRRIGWNEGYTFTNGTLFSTGRN